MQSTMQSSQAFAQPYPLLPNSSTLTPGQCLTQRKPRSAPSRPHVLRRQRLHCSATSPPPDSGEKPEAKSPPEGMADPDTDASDLVLPNLKELFAGAGRPGCEQCDGKGEIGCPVCEGKGFVALTMMDTVSSSQCRLCRGGRSIPCPTCREVVYKSVVWWDKVAEEGEDGDEEAKQEGDDDEPRIRWGGNPAGPSP